MGKLKKRGAVYGVIALMLAVAVYLNWSYVDTPDDLLAAGQITDKASASSSSKTPNEAASSAAQHRRNHRNCFRVRLLRTVAPIARKSTR